MQMGGGLGLLTPRLCRLALAGRHALNKEDLVSLSPFLAYLFYGIFSFLHAPCHHGEHRTLQSARPFYHADHVALDRDLRIRRTRPSRGCYKCRLIWTAWLAIGYGMIQFVDARWTSRRESAAGSSRSCGGGAFGLRVFLHLRQSQLLRRLPGHHLPDPAHAVPEDPALEPGRADGDAPGQLGRDRRTKGALAWLRARSASCSPRWRCTITQNTAVRIRLRRFSYDGRLRRDRPARRHREELVDARRLGQLSAVYTWEATLGDDPHPSVHRLGRGRLPAVVPGVPSPADLSYRRQAQHRDRPCRGRVSRGVLGPRHPRLRDLLVARLQHAC